MFKKLRLYFLLLMPTLLLSCVTPSEGEQPPAPGLNYPTGLSVPSAWQNGATFYLPKLLRAPGLPESYDAPSTPAKDQGTCGSCSHFASIAVYESVLMKKTGIVADLSEQNVLNCAKYDNYKCQGSFYHGRHLVENGAPLDSLDPYVGRATQCRSLPTAYEKPESFAYVGRSGRNPTEEELRDALFNKGALWVTVYADDKWNNPGPILRNGGRGQSNHAVTAVGYKPDPQRPGRYLFRIKNSWGPRWNGDGHVWVQYGTANFGESAAFLSLKGGNDGDDVCTPAVLNVPSTMAVVKGKEVSFAVKPQPGFTYEWYDGTRSVGKGAQVFYAAQNATTMKLVATNKCGSSEVTIKLQLAVSML